MDYAIRKYVGYLGDLVRISKCIEKLLDELNKRECSECYNVMNEEGIRIDEWINKHCKECIIYAIKNLLKSAKENIEEAIEQLTEHIARVISQ